MATRLVEITRTPKAPTVDADTVRKTGVIPGVKLVGLESANGYRYRHSALAQAVGEGKYTGVKVYLNHGRGERDVRECVGVVKAPRMEADGVWGDVKLKRTASSFDSLIESATDPDFYATLGMSHVAECDFEGRGRNREVVRIPSVESVDFVDDPATTKGLYESKGAGMKTIKQILESTAKGYADNDKLRAILREMVEGDAALADAPTEAPASGGSEGEVRAGIMAAIAAKLEAASSDQLKKVLKALELGDSVSELIAGPSTPAPEADPAAPPSQESRIRLIEAENMLHRLNREAKEPWIAALAGLTSEAAQKAFVETLPARESAPRKGSARPESSPPRYSESNHGGGDDEVKRIEEAHAERMKRSDARLAESRR